MGIIFVAEIGDVSKQQDLGGFYRHLYQTTVAEDDNKDKVYKKPEFSPSDKKSKDKISEEELENSKVPNQSTEVFDRKTQEKTSRSYRKRKKSESSDEEEVEKESKKNKVDKKRRSKETPEKRKEKKNKEEEEEESKQRLEKGEEEII